MVWFQPIEDAIVCSRGPEEESQNAPKKHPKHHSRTLIVKIYNYITAVSYPNSDVQGWNPGELVRALTPERHSGGLEYPSGKVSSAP